MRHPVESVTARELMNPRVVTVRDDRTLEELAALLAEHQISGVAVLDPRGKPVGVVSSTDLAELASEGSPPEGREASGDERGLDAWEIRKLRLTGGQRLVRDIMTPTIYTIPEDTPAAEVAKTLIAGRIHRLFVTAGGRLVGIVTALDVLQLVADPDRVLARVPAP